MLIFLYIWIVFRIEDFIRILRKMGELYIFRDFLFKIINVKVMVRKLFFLKYRL